MLTLCFITHLLNHFRHHIGHRQGHRRGRAGAGDLGYSQTERRGSGFCPAVFGFNVKPHKAQLSQLL